MYIMYYLITLNATQSVVMLPNHWVTSGQVPRRLTYVQHLVPTLAGPLRSLRYEGIVLMRSQMKRQIEVPNLEVGSHMSCDILELHK